MLVGCPGQQASGFPPVVGGFVGPSLSPGTEWSTVFPGILSSDRTPLAIRAPSPLSPKVVAHSQLFCLPWELAFCGGFSVGLLSPHHLLTISPLAAFPRGLGFCDLLSVPIRDLTRKAPFITAHSREEPLWAAPFPRQSANRFSYAFQLLGF